MTSKRDLMARLAAAEQALAPKRLGPQGVRRIANRIAKELDGTEQRRKLRWVPMLTFAAGAAVVVVFLAWLNAPRASLAPQVAAHGTASLLISGEGCGQTQNEGTLQLTNACEIVGQDPPMQIQTTKGARVSLEGDRVLRLHQGSALFDFGKVVGDPVRVLTPGGQIVVVGTRFRVVVSGLGGEVDLYEGRLEFHAADGSIVYIEAGERFEFGKPPASSAAAKPVSVATAPATPIGRPRMAQPRPARKAATRRRPTPDIEPTPTKRDAGELIAEVDQLRAQGRYRDAAGRLSAALRGRWPTRTAEVLSNELGRILTRHLGDSARACTHWTAHLTRFPKTRYRKRIERSMMSLKCM